MKVGTKEKGIIVDAFKLLISLNEP